MRKTPHKIQKLVLTLIALFLQASVLLAQNTVRGTVTDTTGSPLTGVSIVIKGTNKGTSTNEQGQFTLQAKPDATLIISYIGFVPRQVQVGNDNEPRIELIPSATAGTEVIITALGIKKAERAVGYATQEVKGASLEKAREPNVFSGLNGKVAGLTISNTSALYNNPGIYLRGESPLFVIDGVATQTDGWNLNPDDIESITVLKSDAAALLYGSLGQNGAVQITTKKGKAGANGTEVSLNQSIQFDAGFLNLPKTQQDYGMGWDGYYAFIDGQGGGGWYDNYGYVWGPKLNQKDPNTTSGYLEVPQYNSPYDPNQTFQFTEAGYTDYSHYKPMPWITRDQNNLKSFLRRELLNTTNVSIAGKSDKADYRISATQLFQQGQIPNTKLNATTLNLSGSVKLARKLRAEATLSYNKQYTPNYPSTAYGPANEFYDILLWMGPDVNVKDMRNYWKYAGENPNGGAAYGTKNLQQFTYNYTWYNNPWFIANELLHGYTNDVVVAQANITYDIAKNLKLLVRSGGTISNVLDELKTPYSFINYTAAPNGNYSQTRSNNTMIVSEAMLTYDKSFLKNFHATVSVGAADRYQSYSYLSASTNGLAIPDVYNLSNTLNTPPPPTNYLSELEVKSLYGYTDLSYKDMVYANISLRNDWSSALQKPYNSFLYPSVSLSLIASEMLKLPKFISYAKLRGAYADVSGDPSAYYTLPTYSTGTRWNGTPSLNLPGTFIDSSIHPYRVQSREGGLEMRFLNNRVGFDVTYFNYLESDDIETIPFSSASGYSGELTNANKYIRKGTEIELNGTPVHSKNFSWNIAINYATWGRYVKQWSNGETYGGSNGNLKVGDRTDQYYGWTWERSPDGKIVYDAGTGMPVYINHPVNMGHTNEDWSFGVSNNLNYKNFSLGFSLDGRVGGVMFDGTEGKLYEGGNEVHTDNHFRDDAYAGNATYVGDGVVVTSGSATYDVQGKITSDTRKFAPNTTKVNYIDWVFNYYVNGVDGADMYKKTFVKLREVTLTYKFMPAFLKHTRIKSASVSVVGRNLALFTKVPYMDPDTYLANGGGYDLPEPTYRNIGINLNLKF